MEKSIIEALYNGKIAPWERRFMHTPERDKLEERIEAEKNYFQGKMSEDDWAHFAKLEELLGNTSAYEDIDSYLHGFTLGALIMLEIMEKKDIIINE